ncbi:MAG: Sir2 family NAD-dependent protein deacetylase [Candidatus Nanopelagicales bacterium]
MADPAPVHAAAQLLSDAAHVFVLAGAGMGTESGIPDFRGPDGLWTRNPQAQRMFDLDAYRADAQLRSDAWRMRMASEIRTSRPNAGHGSIAAWEGKRRVTVATQNIDGLQQRAGSSEVLELHGSYWESMCLDCDDRRPISEVFARVESGDPDPTCEDCGGILKTGTVAFGQALPIQTWTAAQEAAMACDIAFAIGSTLTVQPAASLATLAVQGGSPLVVINGDPTHADAGADVVIHDRIGPTLTLITQALADR